MKEILFRGKRKDNGEWVYGFVANASHSIIGIFKNAFNFFVEEVIPETVGQYTGLCDKNGNKIYEGDILKFSDRLVKVQWHEYCGSWDCSFIKYIGEEKTSREDRRPNMWRWNATIVGNIHDNPDFLEQDK